MPESTASDTSATAFDGAGRALASAPGAWSVAVVDAASDEVLFAHRPEVVLPTASSAKVLALVAAAVAIESGDADPVTLLRRGAVEPVSDSGLWQHLRVDALSFDDVAYLVGVFSDNLATNVLLAYLGGVDRVEEVAARLGVRGIRLLDIVRDERAAEHPDTLSRGSARAYADLFARLARREVGEPAASERVLAWLRDGVDMSMVASAFGLDPLAHSAPDRAVALWHKTGTDLGVRADSGLVSARGRKIAYSCLVEFDDAYRDDVLRVMRMVGSGIRAELR